MLFIFSLPLPLFTALISNSRERERELQVSFDGRQQNSELSFSLLFNQTRLQTFFRKEKRKNHNRIMSFKQNGGTFENFGELLERL